MASPPGPRAATFGLSGISGSMLSTSLSMLKVFSVDLMVGLMIGDMALEDGGGVAPGVVAGVAPALEADDMEKDWRSLVQMTGTSRARTLSANKGLPPQHLLRLLTAS